MVEPFTRSIDTQTMFSNLPPSIKKILGILGKCCIVEKSSSGTDSLFRQFLCEGGQV